MNITLLRHAQKLFKNYNVSEETKRNYQRAWARSVHQLGNKWLLAKKAERIS